MNRTLHFLLKAPSLKVSTFLIICMITMLIFIGCGGNSDEGIPPLPPRSTACIDTQPLPRNFNTTSEIITRVVGDEFNTPAEEIIEQLYVFDDFVNLGNEFDAVDIIYDERLDITIIPINEQNNAFLEELQSMDIEIFVDYPVQPDFVPNDPLWDLQPNLMAGFPGSINAEEAWDIVQNPGEGITIAVLDTGINYNHPDLTDRNIGSLLLGGSFSSDGSITSVDFHGHGTHVASTIIEKHNNQLGATGIAFASTVAGIKVLPGNSINIAVGLIEACDDFGPIAADIVNMSLGTTTINSQGIKIGVPCTEIPVYQQAINFCISQNVLVVATAGNSSNVGLVVTNRQAPADCNGVISVASNRLDGSRAYYSTCGPWVDISAPGGDHSVDQNNDGRMDWIWQSTLTTAGDQPQEFTGFNGPKFEGTSMAAPHVTAAAALALQKGITPQDVLNELCRTSTKVNDPGTGCGVVNVYELVK